MLATQPSLRESYSPQQQYADNLAVGEDRICPGCKLSAVTEEGGLVVAFGSSLFHVDCFRCAKCSNKVTADTNLLLLSDGSPICANCSYSCNVCKLPILDEAIMTGDDSYHAHCFKCKVCKNRIDELVFAKTSQGIYCMNCHNERMIRIRKHAQKKAEREREKERERNALNGSANSRDKDMRLREERRTSSGAPETQEATSSLKQSQPSRGSLPDRVKSPPSSNLHSPYVADAFQTGQTETQPPSTYPISVTVAPPLENSEIPISHPPVFQPPPRTSSVDQDRSTPIKKNTAPANTHPSLADLEPHRTNSVDDFTSKVHRSSSGSTEVPHISVPSTNGGLGVTSRAEKRRSINPGLVLDNFKSIPDGGGSTATPALSPLSANSIKSTSHSSTIPPQNGYEPSHAPSPFRDRFPPETYSRPGSAQSSHPPHSPTTLSQQNHEGSRTRPTSSEATLLDDQTVVLRPPLRSSTSESHSIRMHRDSQDLLPMQTLEDRPGSRRRSGQRLSSTSRRSQSANQSRPNSRADVPHSIESATESETDNETHESIEPTPPALPPKETMSESVREDNSSDVHPLADLLSLKSDEQESSALSLPDSDETSESSPVEQTSHATFIAPALPPIRFSLSGADFSDLFTSVSGLPPLQQLAQLASVTEQKTEGDDQTPITPPPTASTISRSVSENIDDVQLREGNPFKSAVNVNHSVAHTRGRSSSEARADSLRKMHAPSQLSLTTIGSDTTQITISPPAEPDDKQEKSDAADLVLTRLQEVLADAKDRGAQQLKLDRGFIEAIIQAMTARKADFSEMKGNLDGMKRASKQYMEGLTVAQTEYDRELKQRRELEAEVTRLRVLLSGQAARLTALSGDSRRQELRQQMTKELNKNLSGLEQDLSKLKVQRDMTLAEMEEISASKSEPSGQEPGSSLGRSLTKRLDNLKTQYQRELVPLTQERETLAREIMELKAARDIFLEETTVLNARNEELAQLSAQYARRMASAPDTPPKSQEPRVKEQPFTETDKLKSRPPPITIQYSSHAKFPPQPSQSQPLAPPQPSVDRSLTVQPTFVPPPAQNHPPPPAPLNLPQADEQPPDSRGKHVDGTPSKPPRFGMKWGVSRSKDPIAPPSHAKGVLEHIFQPLSLLRFTRCDHCGDKMWGSQLRCTGCNVSVHTRCVSHVQSYCSQQSQQSHASQEDSQPLPPSMFGRDLVEQVRSDAKGSSRQVPVIVEKCIQAVETLGMEYEGIYRKTGGSGQSRVITQLFERGDYDAFDLCDQDKFNDICSVTSVLKTYLRSLPVPLLTHDLHDHFMSAVEIRDVETKNSRLTDLVNKLPPEHYHTLRMLMLHLNRIRERCEINLMNARNLGVVFGPTLMRSRIPGAEFSDMAGKALSVEWMVENAPKVFM